MSHAIFQFRIGIGSVVVVAVAAVLLTVIGPRDVSAQEQQLTPEQQQMLQRLSSIQWVEGPTTARIGTMAEIQIPAGYQFANATDAQTLLEVYGNPRNPGILGAIVPMAEDASWTLIFKFDDIGYVQDADKESIDADEILSSFQSGLGSMNEARRAVGAAECSSISWMEKPFYDPQTNNLTWALRLGFNDGDSVNYDIRILGRRGVMEATLLDSPETYAKSIPDVKQVLTGFAFTSGEKYAEWQQGDKIAAYGLTGLVAGGGLAMAAKTGLLGKLGLLLAKGGKAIILAVVVIFGAGMSIVKRLLGGGGQAA
ncbi:MAG TPA: DUF2167 domain-containing protein [Planctomycetaceae bacterium]|nr:DUF2167 domain-containing protein [Planctomycetaceae bacterium]